MFPAGVTLTAELVSSRVISTEKVPILTFPLWNLVWCRKDRAGLLSTPEKIDVTITAVEGFICPWLFYSHTLKRYVNGINGLQWKCACNNFSSNLFPNSVTFHQKLITLYWYHYQTPQKNQQTILWICCVWSMKTKIEVGIKKKYTLFLAEQYRLL